jgi:hypothetical protein
MSKQAAMVALEATTAIQQALHTVFAGWTQPGLGSARLALMQIAKAHDTLSDALGSLNTEIHARHDAGKWEAA